MSKRVAIRVSTRERRPQPCPRCLQSYPEPASGPVAEESVTNWWSRLIASAVVGGATHDERLQFRSEDVGLFLRRRIPIGLLRLYDLWLRGAPMIRLGSR